MMADDVEEEVNEWGVAPYAIIREIYESEDAQLYFEEQLENALDGGVPYIVIEPRQIGNETAKWIQLGNFLHKTTVLSGLTCLISPLVLPRKYCNVSSYCFAGLSLGCATIYGLSWQYDPCCKYQIEYDTKELERFHMESLTTSTPVVLVRRDDKHRKILHNVVALMVLSYCGWKAHAWYTS